MLGVGAVVLGGSAVVAVPSAAPLAPAFFFPEEDEDLKSDFPEKKLNILVS